MDGYHRQIHHGEYPLAIIAIDIAPHLVDVNVHPRKIQVKFVDPGIVFTNVRDIIVQSLGENKTFHGEHKIPSSLPSKQVIQTNEPSSLFTTETQLEQQRSQVFIKDNYIEAIPQQHHTTEYKVVGQIRDSYIIVQHINGLRYIDQHALAERIAFEKLKKNISDGNYSSTTLLNPISIQLPAHQDSQIISDQLNTLKFETTVR